MHELTKMSCNQTTLIKGERINIKDLHVFRSDMKALVSVIKCSDRRQHGNHK